MKLPLIFQFSQVTMLNSAKCNAYPSSRHQDDRKITFESLYIQLQHFIFAIIMVLSFVPSSQAQVKRGFTIGTQSLIPIQDLSRVTNWGLGLNFSYNFGRKNALWDYSINFRYDHFYGKSLDVVSAFPQNTSNLTYPDIGLSLLSFGINYHIPENKNFYLSLETGLGSTLVSGENLNYLINTGYTIPQNDALIAFCPKIGYLFPLKKGYLNVSLNFNVISPIIRIDLSKSFGATPKDIGGYSSISLSVGYRITK